MGSAHRPMMRRQAAAALMLFPLLLLLQLLLLIPAATAAAATISSPPQQLPHRAASADVSWPAFLRRHDMVWSWSAANNSTWPAAWQTAAWCGNGLHGLSPLLDRASGRMRFEVARTDI
jgi:hypothetical protein